MNHNEELEIILYKIIEELSKDEAPIVFKGGLALKDLLYIYNSKLNIIRKTVDIDGNWINKYDENFIVEKISSAVTKVNEKYSVKISRLPA